MNAAMLASKVCPYCRSGFVPEDEVTFCPSCGTPHHADCFAENGGCTIFGCASAPPEEEKISVGAEELRLGMVPAGPPPPMGQPATAPPPPPMPGAEMQPCAAFPSPTLYGAYDYATYAAGYVQPKSRVVYVLLAVFLGSFGAHNFYAGYNKKGTIQLLVTILTCFWASLITWIWAIVEACTVTTDDDGMLMS